MLEVRFILLICYIHIRANLIYMKESISVISLFPSLVDFPAHIFFSKTLWQNSIRDFTRHFVDAIGIVFKSQWHSECATSKYCDSQRVLKMPQANGEIEISLKNILKLPISKTISRIWYCLYKKFQLQHVFVSKLFIDRTCTRKRLPRAHVI